MARLKQRIWLYMDMTYFRSMVGFRRAKRWLYVAAPIVAAAWVASAAAQKDLMPYSSGTMSAMHGHFAQECDRCHADGWAALQPTVEKDRALNARCVACHGPTFGHDPVTNSAWHGYTGADHVGTLESEVGCSSCHLEHQGRDTLVQVPDSSCTVCHADLGPTLRGRALQVMAKTSLQVRSFEPGGGHPDFKMFEGGATPTDPGTIAFSHHFHLVPGDYDPRSDVLIQGGLQCVDCHRAGESAQPWRFASKAREAHRDDKSQSGHSDPELVAAFMKPIRYSLHCGSCHPLTADSRLTGNDSVLPGTVPHERSAVVRSYLQGQLLAYAMGTSRDARDWPDGRVPLPRRLEDPAQDEAALLEWVRGEVQKIERQLYAPGGACLKCHVVAAPYDERALEPPPIADPAIPARWVRHAAFDHSVHRAESTCADCHPQATDPSYKLARWDGAVARGEGRDGAEAVMLPRMDLCRECHGKLEREGSKWRGGIVADCATCHTFHRPLQAVTSGAGGS